MPASVGNPPRRGARGTHLLGEFSEWRRSPGFIRLRLTSGCARERAALISSSLSRVDCTAGVDDSYNRERLADVVRLLYQEAGRRIRRSMTRGDCTHDDD